MRRQDTKKPCYDGRFSKRKGAYVFMGECRCCEGAVEVLEKLSKEVNCHMATNANDSNKVHIQKALKRVGLNKYIKEIYCYRSVGYEKPSKEFFDFLIKDLNAELKEVVVVGDCLQKDVLCTLSCGINTIWFNASNEKCPASVISINKLIDIIDV